MHLDDADTRLDEAPAEHTTVVHIDTGRRLDPLAQVLPVGTAYRMAPLLAVLTIAGDTALAVGRYVVITTRTGTTIEAHVRGLWSSSSGAPVGPGAPEPGSRSWRGVAELAGTDAALAEWVQGVRWSVHGEVEGQATHTAKALAESSRDTVAEIRALRYEIEAHLSETIRGESSSRLDAVLADLVELSIIVGRAQDEARDAVREGMGAWRTAAGLYHAQRHRQDPSLPERAGRAAAEALPWFPIHDAGVRQCAAAERLLGEELQLLQGRLSAAATVATARDAQAQESFTLIATVGGVALGVPGVIVGLYGVSDVLPLGWDGRSAAVVFPLALTCLLAAVLAYALTPGPHLRKARRAGAAMGYVLLLVFVITFAGYWFPAS